MSVQRQLMLSAVQCSFGDQWLLPNVPGLVSILTSWYKPLDVCVRVCMCTSLQILEIIRVILKLYDQWKNFDDRKEMAAVLNKMPKPKPPPNR